MRSTLPLRRWAVGLLMLGAAVGAQAGARWSFDLSLGLPIGGYYAGPVFGAPAYGTVATALPVGAISVEIGGGRYWRHGGIWYRPWGPRWVVVAPPVMVPVMPAQTVVETAPLPATPNRPDPVIYPRSGQSAAQTEYDRQECNRWATTQPAALADAAIFHRAVEACMDGRGYTMK